MTDPDNHTVLDAVDLIAERLQRSGEHEPEWAAMLRFELAAQAAMITGPETRFAALEGDSKPPSGPPCIA